MPSEGHYVAVYDISSDRERTRLSQVLESYGFRVQQSAFELRLSKPMRERLLDEIAKLTLKSGFLYLYRLREPLSRQGAGVCPLEPFSEERHAYVI